MTDENIVPVAPQPAQLNPATDNSDHALTGKIARLPHDIREQLNQRLLDGQSGTEILPWLNNLAPVKDILAAQFDSRPINSPNLTYWRQNGFQRWLSEKRRLSTLKERCQYRASRSRRRRFRFGQNSRISRHRQCRGNEPGQHYKICRGCFLPC
jgi:hypothetical protein